MEYGSTTLLTVKPLQIFSVGSSFMLSQLLPFEVPFRIFTFIQIACVYAVMLDKIQFKFQSFLLFNNIDLVSFM